jgi:hypothetical protein
VRNGASVHHSTIQRKHTYTTQFKENRQWSRETFCGTPIGDTELSKWIPEAAARRLRRPAAPPLPEHVITTTTPPEHEHNLRMESEHAFKRRSEPSRVRREGNRKKGAYFRRRGGRRSISISLTFLSQQVT